ncbi:MAG: DPP IV N-terminal domain-containing protein [Acidobacteriota bacterium]|nr:DPP IV N-terminal domain-containing protein [Acidobacteriota bacterium]
MATFAGAADTPADPSRLTLERIFEDQEFAVASFGPARWLVDGSGYTTLELSPDFEEAKDIIRYDPATEERVVMVPAAALVPGEGVEPLEIDDYQWSEDGTQLLVFTNTERVWRRNTRGDYWLLNIETAAFRKLGGKTPESTMMFAKISPDGQRVAWVNFDDKDLYVQDLATLDVTRLTDDKGEHIINGTSDWVYEEEFDLRDGFRWSPDSRHIAYWQFDSEGVGTFNLINNTSGIYPEMTAVPYPKVGTTNSACRIGVIPADGGDTTWFEPEGDPRNNYIPKMGWVANPQEIWLIQLNRLQNTAQVMLGDVSDGTLKTIFTDRDEAWVDLHDDPQWLQKGRYFTWLSERDGWRHLYLVARDGKDVRLVTSGGYDVIDLAMVDDAGGWAYFLASPEDPTSRFLFRTALDGSGTLEKVTPAGPSGAHTYQISEDARWAIHGFSAREIVPQTDLVSLPDHDVRRVLEDNAEIQKAVDAVAKSPIEAFRVDIGDGLEVDGWMITPPDLDPTRVYPLLMFVYGEPWGQTVQNSWGRGGNLWHLLLAQRGYLVASLDNHGTPAPRGRQWRKSVYRQIGILASADQAAGVRAMLDAFRFIDRGRIGSWGWSGGGTMTLNALFRYPELYTMGIAVASVPDQKLYDTVYQERYMGLPEDNTAGFADGSPITHAAGLEGDLLLVHGTGDDNVHYQGVELLINELIAQGKQFDMMAYPNRSHGIREGEGTTMHLYTLMTNYLEEHLEPGPRPRPEAEAVSFLGESLFPPAPQAATEAAYEAARAAWEASPDDVNALIWFGRRSAYLGRYREAINIFSEGIERFPDDARLYRHRGHRYITTRQLDNAVADLEHAAWLVEGTEDEVEPDGMPNALGIPVSTLQSNIWYHLGLAYYLQGDNERAERAYRERAASAANNDMMVSTTNWLYMTLRRLGRDAEAAALLEPITTDTEVIENEAYLRLCLFYKGAFEESDLQIEGLSSSNAAAAYGLATWHMAEGESDIGTAMLEAIVAGDNWAAFGHIAAESDLVRIRNSEFGIRIFGPASASPLD